jgi:hypothetical protein
MKHPPRLTKTLLLLALAAAALIGATAAFAVDQEPKNGCTSPTAYSGAITSPSFATSSGPASVSFQGWFEAEGVAPASHDLTTVEYGLPDPDFPTETIWTSIGQLTPPSTAGGAGADQGVSNNGLAQAPSFQAYPSASAPLSALPSNEANVKIRFVFDAVDSLFNGFRGAGIDNVVINTGGGTTVPPQGFETTFGSGSNDWIADTSAGTGAPFWQVVPNGAGISVKNPQINPELVTLPDSGALPAAGTGTAYAWFGDAATGTFCGPDYANRFVAPPPPPPPPPPKKLTLADLPAPVLGKTANVAPVKGTVLVGIKAGAVSVAGKGRASQKGLTFVPLQEARQVPVGSFLNTRKGTVRLQSAANRAGKRQTGDYSKGLFQVLQSRKKKARGLTSMVLKGGRFTGCGTAKRAQAALSRRTIRRLRASAKGRFRTRGRYSAATVRGTKWTVTDRCDGTLTKVTRGKVAVRDFRRKKTIIVKAGKSYLARARR